MMKYDTFNEWFDEFENYSMRSDRFFEEFSGMTPQRAIEWLEAAWNCARMEECPYCSNPELSEVFFDQTCRCCVERMESHAKELK
jgi:hypothetical protein